MLVVGVVADRGEVVVTDEDQARNQVVVSDRAASVTMGRRLKDHCYHGAFYCGHGPVPTMHVRIQSAVIRRNS